VGGGEVGGWGLGGESSWWFLVFWCGLGVVGGCVLFLDWGWLGLVLFGAGGGGWGGGAFFFFWGGGGGVVLRHTWAALSRAGGSNKEGGPGARSMPVSVMA